MLNVRIIHKYQDDKGSLVGYAIQDEKTLAIKQVYKDALKTAISNGQVSVRSTTLTSDGRLICRALPRLKKPLSDKRILKAIFTENKHVVYGIWAAEQNINVEQIDFEVENHIGLGLYNVNDLSNKVLEEASVKKKSFKSVKVMHIKQLLQKYQVDINEQAMFNAVSVDGKSRGAYDIQINNGGDPSLYNVLMALTLDAVLAAKLKVVSISYDTTYMTLRVNTLLGKKEITDTLKTLVKDIKDVKGAK